MQVPEHLKNPQTTAPTQAQPQQAVVDATPAVGAKTVNIDDAISKW
jgi:hypothetical protein